MPFQIGALMDGAGRSASQVGLFGFCQIGALALSMILISPRIDQVHPALVASASALLATAANVGLFFVQSFQLELLLGATAGIAFGLVFAATIAGAAASDEPDRLYGIGVGGGLLLITIVLTSLPALATHFGPRVIFLGIAALSLLCSMSFFGLARARSAGPSGRIPWATPGVPGLLFSWVALSTGTGAVYSFSERIGRHIHLTSEVIGVVLSAGLFVGLAGTALAAVVADRVSRTRSLLLGMAGTGASCVILGYSENLICFAAGIFLYMLCYMFLYCFFLGTAAYLDATGRVGALGGGMERLSYSGGVWIGGLFAQYISYSIIGLLGFVGCMLGLILGYPSLFRALRVRAELAVDGCA